MNYESVPVSMLFIITIISSFSVCFSKAWFSKKITSRMGDYNLFNTIVSIICAFVIFSLGGFDTKVSSYTFVFAIAFGVLTMAYSVLYSVATNLGTFSYTSVIASSSTMITALSGYFFWDENITPLKITGIIMMFGCYVLSNKRDEFKKKVTLRWFVVCILMAVVLTIIGLCQKTHQMSVHKDEYTMFLVIAFIMSSFTSFLMYIIPAKRIGEYGFENKEKLEKKPFIILITVIITLSAVFLGFNNSINLYLTGIVDTAIFFPVTSGAGIMLNVIASLVFFKEKLRLRQWLGIILGTVSVIILCI